NIEEADHGKAISGGTAYFSTPDMAYLMFRGKKDSQRVIRALGRYSQVPTPIIVDHQAPVGYTLVSDPDEPGETVSRVQVRQALENAPEGLTGSQIEQQTGLAHDTVTRVLQA